MINQLTAKLPEGMLVDAGWLKKQGYSSQLQHVYVSTGWLEQPTRGVFWRAVDHSLRQQNKLGWQQVVISWQNLLNYWPLIVGGRTALELKGYAHYLRQHEAAVHLYGPKAPPGWFEKLPLDTKFVFHKTPRLFRNDPVTKGLNSLKYNVVTGASDDPSEFRGGDVTTLDWGKWDWPLTLSTPERAILEMLDEIPNHETFEQADALFSGLSNLRPQRLQKLLKDCDSVKVKRLFFFFADRHKHAWLSRLNRQDVDLGTGKRQIAVGGMLDHAYQITVPRDLDGLR